MSLGPEDPIDHPLLGIMLGPVDHHGYYGRRDVDGRAVGIVPLIFGRARIVLIDPVSDCPYDGW